MLNHRGLRFIGALVVAIAIPVGLALAGVSLRLGAHPWWDVRTAVIGGIAGAVVSLVLLRVPLLWRGCLGLVGLTGSGFLAWTGKTRFAASYAEDVVAGQYWYFGWIGVAAGLSVLIAALLAPGARAQATGR